MSRIAIKTIDIDQDHAVNQYDDHHDDHDNHDDHGDDDCCDDQMSACEQLSCEQSPMAVDGRAGDCTPDTTTSS